MDTAYLPTSTKRPSRAMVSRLLSIGSALLLAGLVANWLHPPKSPLS
jgi:hypothetical protein